MPARIEIKKGRAKPLWHGHPWVYAQAVAKLKGSAETGDVVDVYEASGGFVGRGFYNSQSAITVRLLSWRQQEEIDGAFLERRLLRALELRRRLALPTAETNAYRLVNAEGDGLPGLVVDVYGSSVVVHITTKGMALLKGELYSSLQKLLKPSHLLANIGGAFSSQENLEKMSEWVVGKGEKIQVRENGLRFWVDLEQSQKTGLFLDQRENRDLFGRLSEGMRVLDLCTYVGGFALNAAKGGAKEVVAVDVSASALAAAKANLALNAELVDTSTLEFVEEDLFKYLARPELGKFGLVVVDPPKFARRRKDLKAALQGYRKLHRLAVGLVEDGGLLCTACCSQLVGEEEFRRSLSAGALDGDKEVQIISQAGAGADHPNLPAFAEGEYLKFLLCRVHDR